MRTRRNDLDRWSHEIGRHDWYNENEFDSFRPPRRYYRTSSGTSVPHHHHEEHKHRDDHPGKFNRFDPHDNRYVMKYDLGRGRYHASYGEGYADSPRGDDRDWDNGRNTYWRERYHHQGHPHDDSWFRRAGDRIRDSWNDWRYGESRDDYRAHQRGYSSNYRDEDRRYGEQRFRGGWHIDDEYFRH